MDFLTQRGRKHEELPVAPSSWSAEYARPTQTVALAGDTGAARPSASVPRRAAGFLLPLVAVLGVGLGYPGAAHADGGLGDSCNVANVNVNEKIRNFTGYTYEVDCPGRPLGWFGGDATAHYQVVGYWEPREHVAIDHVFSVERNAKLTDEWTCSADPWLTPSAFVGAPRESHTCELKSHSGGDDWLTDTPQDQASWTSVMCFNDPWGASLAGCWSTDQRSVAGPSNAIVNAYIANYPPKPTGPKPPPPPPPSQG